MAPWRIKGDQQEKAYSRRSFVWKWIEDLIDKGATEAEAIATVKVEVGTNSIYTKVDKLRKAAKMAASGVADI